jgi:O-antigen ligase
LWLRLLAEGGIVGFASFMTWYMLVTFGAVVLWRKDTRLSRVLGLGGIIGSTTFFFEGFSLDTYALPHFWVLFGLISCGIHGLIQGTHD